MRVEIQRSRDGAVDGAGTEPGRLESKIMVRASHERKQVVSPNSVLNAVTGTGVDQLSKMLRRVDVQMSVLVMDPRQKKISRPSIRIVGAASFPFAAVLGELCELSSATGTAGCSTSPERFTVAT